MENLEKWLTPKTFNTFSYLAVVCWILYGVTLLGIFSELENSDSFRCEAKPDKMDLVRGKCSDQYKKQYNRSGIPVYGFVIANFSLIVIVCVIYSLVVRSRVAEVEANRRSADAKTPLIQNNDDHRPKRRLFVAYFCQLATRFVIGIIFIVLQTQVLYPDNFPSNFYCQIAAASHAVSASSTSNIQNSTMYECYNPQATKITFLMNAVIVGNGVLALIILIEIICILALRVKKGKEKEFLEDSVFLEYLRKRSQEEEPQDSVSTLEEPQHPEQEASNEQEDSGQVPKSPMGPEEEPPEQPSVIAEFLENQKKTIRESTEKDRGLKALFQEKHGEGKRKKDLKFDHIYTKLSLIKEVFPMPQKEFQQITREEIVDAENKKILIVGRPGIGKTLFLTRWIRDWASGEALNGELHFDFAFFLKFRKFKSVGKEPLSLRGLLSTSEYSETERLSDRVWSHVLRKPEKVLIFFDGLDEFSYRSRIANESFCNNVEKPMPLSDLYYNIVKGNLLRGATVLTTTRPSAMDEVTDLPFDKTIEILGFASEQVEEYVENFAKDAGEDVQDAGKKIWEHIKTNMNIFSLCYIPVNCLIICSCLLQVLKLPGETGVGLPAKLTDIYQRYVKLFFFRHDVHRGKDVLREDINSKRLPPELEEKIKPLAKLAFDGLRKKTLIFGRNEVSEDLVNCALLHCLPDGKTANDPYTKEPQYCFIHLTMQEFLAARYVTETMEGEELRSFVADHIKNGEWQLVLQFVAGLLGEQSIDIFTDLLPKTTKERDENDLMLDYTLEPRTVTCWPTRSEKGLALTLLKCIQETNESGSVIQSKLEEIGLNAVDFSRCRLAPADCTAVVHFIKRVPQIVVLQLISNNIGSLGCVEIAKLFDNANCQLRSLNLGYNDIDDEGVKQLSNALETNDKLRRLYLHGNRKITHEARKQFKEANPNCKVYEP